MRAQKSAAPVAWSQVPPSEEYQTSFLLPLPSNPPMTQILLLKTMLA